MKTKFLSPSSKGRLAGSVSRAVLLAFCLLSWLACVTPFPFDKLERDMTMEQATAALGEPRSTSAEELSEAVQLLQKENHRLYELLESAVDLSETRGPVARELAQSSTETLRSLEQFVADLDEASREQGVRSTWIYPYKEYPLAPLNYTAVKKEVELLFEGNKLVSWNSRTLPSVPGTSTYVYSTESSEFPSLTLPHRSKKDTKHHKKGHDHHHYDSKKDTKHHKKGHDHHRD